MTAINVILRPEAAYMLTDGFTRDTDLHGNPILHPRQKVMPLASINAAVAVRGAYAVLPILCNYIMHACPNFETASEILGDCLRVVCESIRTNHHPALVPHEAVLAGWPQSGNAPQCAFTMDSNRYGHDPYSTLLLDTLVSPGDASLPFQAEDLQPFDGPFDPVTDGVVLVDAQRRLPADVGGFCQLTTVRRTSIETCILKRWPEDSDRAPPHFKPSRAVADQVGSYASYPAASR